MMRWPPDRVVDGSGLTLPEWAAMVANLVGEGRLDVLVAELRNALGPALAATDFLSISKGIDQEKQDRITFGIEMMLAVVATMEAVITRKEAFRQESKRIERLLGDHRLDEARTALAALEEGVVSPNWEEKHLLSGLQWELHDLAVNGPDDSEE